MYRQNMHAPPVIQSENSRDSLSKPRGASQMWEIDSDWSKVYVIHNLIESNKPLWITCTLDQLESTSYIWEAPREFDKLSREFLDWITGCIFRLAEHRRLIYRRCLYHIQRTEFWSAVRMEEDEKKWVNILGRESFLDPWSGIAVFYNSADATL